MAGLSDFQGFRFAGRRLLGGMDFPLRRVGAIGHDFVSGNRTGWQVNSPFWTIPLWNLLWRRLCCNGTPWKNLFLVVNTNCFGKCFAPRERKPSSLRSIWPSDWEKLSHLSAN